KRYDQGGSWRYEVLLPGFKYNMTDIQAAIGLWQLRKQDAFQRRRREVVARYTAMFAGEEALEPPVARPDVEPAWHLYVLRLRRQALRIGRDRFIEELAARTPITGAITLHSELAAQRSGAVDYAPVCTRYGIPLARVGSINEPDGLAALRTLDADVVFVIGWSQILRPAALRLARTGMIGAHASLLPQLRGSAPINWALIRGERQTGNSLIWLAEDVDQGAIIDQ